LCAPHRCSRIDRDVSVSRVPGNERRSGARCAQLRLLKGAAYEELKADLTQDLLELERLTGIWPSTIEKRHDKEQAIGRLCYLAEEDLSPLELNTLKRALGINDTRWRTFKAKFIEGSSPGELA
jgi:hypothetical protein